MYVLFSSPLKFSNLASIEIIWLFFWIFLNVYVFYLFCLWNFLIWLVYKWSGYFSTFYLLLYVLFSFSLNFFQFALHSNYLVFFVILLFNFCIYLIYFICIVRSRLSGYRNRVMAEIWTLDCVCLLESSDFKECDTQVSPFPKTLECPVDTPFFF